MKLKKIVQESDFPKRKRMKVMITESQLKNLISKTLDNHDLKNTLKNEKK
jgi:hypothetical protein